MRCRAVVVGLVAGGTLLAAAGPASALSVLTESPVGGKEPATVEVADDGGEANAVTVTVEGDALIVTDTAAKQVRALVGCSKIGGVASRRISCPLPGKVRINLNADNDAVDVGPGVPAPTVFGGEGDDTITGASRAYGQGGADTITGTPGNDYLDGGIGTDVVRADAGDDVVREGTAAEPDTLDGGEGNDTLTFSGRSTPVVADLGTGGQTAGGVGEGNTVAGFERLIGGSGGDQLRVAVPVSGTAPVLIGKRGDDTLTLGGPAAGRVLGGKGDDRLTGGRGADRLEGEDGRDTVSGGGGDDAVFGGIGRDRVSGGAGDDRIDPGLGRDTAKGGSGRDRFIARDTQRDRIDGGAGRDRARVDTIDRVRRVERVAKRV